MIAAAVDVLIIILLFASFGVLHSFLASLKVKQYLNRRLGKHIAFYRLFYNVSSIIYLVLIFDLAPRPDIQLYNLPEPFDIIILVPQLFGLAGIFWTLRYFCAREFLGVNQIIRWFNNEYNVKELDEHLTLRIGGPYRYSRHPLYFFSITLLLFRAEMNLYYLVFLFCIAAYFVIGSYFEEKKLVEQFGDIYKKYQNAVPRIIPLKPFKPYQVY